MTQAVSSNGTLLKMGDGGSPEAFTTIAEVLDITGPQLEAGTEEVTNQDSAGWREYIVTLLSGGEVSFDVNWFNDVTQGFDTGLMDFRVAPFADVARQGTWFVDTGLEFRLSIASMVTVSLSTGRDLKAGRTVFFSNITRR